MSEPQPAAETPSEPPRSRRGCRRVGCVGCAGTLLLATVAAAAIAVRLSEADPPALRREQPVLEFDLSQAETTLALDLRHGTFTLRPGPSDQPLRVEADYDASTYDLSIEESDVGTRKEIVFGARGGWWSTLGRTARNSLTITVPQGSPVSVDGRLGVGRSRLEFGGLTVRSIELATRTGDHEILFSLPLSVPMERLRIEGSTSSLFVGELGNASPTQVAIVHRMGRLDLDLRGGWQRSATIEGRVSLGDLMIRRPRSAYASFEKCSVQMGQREELEAAAHLDSEIVVDVDLDVSFGDLEIR